MSSTDDIFTNPLFIGLNLADLPSLLIEMRYETKWGFINELASLIRTMKQIRESDTEEYVIEGSQLILMISTLESMRKSYEKIGMIIYINFRYLSTHSRGKFSMSLTNYTLMLKVLKEIFEIFMQVSPEFNNQCQRHPPQPQYNYSYRSPPQPQPQPPPQPPPQHYNQQHPSHTYQNYQHHGANQRHHYDAKFAPRQQPYVPPPQLRPEFAPRQAPHVPPPQLRPEFAPRQPPHVPPPQLRPEFAPRQAPREAPKLRPEYDYNAAPPHYQPPPGGLT